jgi:hypothetical protein
MPFPGSIKPLQAVVGPLGNTPGLHQRTNYHRLRPIRNGKPLSLVSDSWYPGAAWNRILRLTRKHLSTVLNGTFSSVGRGPTISHLPKRTVDFPFHTETFVQLLLFKRASRLALNLLASG